MGGNRALEKWIIRIMKIKPSHHSFEKEMKEKQYRRKVKIGGARGRGPMGRKDNIYKITKDIFFFID